jgi:hypothetical protein
MNQAEKLVWAAAYVSRLSHVYDPSFMDHLENDLCLLAVEATEFANMAVEAGCKHGCCCVLIDDNPAAIRTMVDRLAFAALSFHNWT